MKKTRTKRELIEFLENTPHPDNTPVFIYIEEMDKLVDNGESPQTIKSIDDSMSDRIDLNI